MADNAKASEDPLVAADEIGGAKFQRVKLTHGPDGSATDASSAAPLPVADADALAELEAIAAALGSTIKVGDGSGALTIDFGTALPSGTNNIGQVDPRGNKAHDEGDAGNPVKVGARARTALPAAVAQDDRVDAIADKHGRQLATVAPLDERVSATLNRTNETAGQLFAALAEGAYVVTAIMVDNASATVGTKVEILDGASVKWKGYAGVLGGGFVVSEPNGLFVGSKNTKLEAKCATTGADVDISVSAYKIPA